MFTCYVFESRNCFWIAHCGLDGRWGLKIDDDDGSRGFKWGGGGEC